MTELQQTGQTVFPTNMTRMWLSLLGTLGFTALGLWILFNPHPTMRFPSWVVVIFGAAAVLFFGVIGIPSLLFQMARRNRLLVDMERGLSFGSEKIGAQAEADIAWEEVKRVRSWGYGVNSFTIVNLKPEAYARVQRQSSTFNRVLTAANSKMIGENAYYFPATLKDNRQLPYVLEAVWTQKFGEPDYSQGPLA
ncbi:STM3941 family protein [Arthrobacter sp. UM1]|uniref:STM3941 family protein n=1 Tax=Arthrobacter sp. UM1 TaxID=2766776 RepID=UPI001CF688E1|nr:STM3941 family protein [Arthrobacter sp. UM1]MCB4208691.1 hypothetical protein [Arthrobacter sp. UM1]